MQTETNPTETSPIELALAKQNVTAQVIAKLKSDYSGLTINGIDDKEGFEAVEKARKECKAVRVLATKICKAGREDAVKIQKDWIAKEKEVVGQIEEIENTLEAESNRIKEEEKAILFKAAQEAKLPMRKEKLLNIGITVADEELLKLDDANFLQLFNEFYETHLEEKAKKIREDEEKRQAEEKEKEAQLKEEKLKIHNERKEALKPFWQFIPADQSSVDFSEITPEQYQDILTAAFETKDRVEAEQKQLEEANKKLAEENAAKEKALKEQEEKAAKEKAEAEKKQKALEKELADKKAAEAKAKAEEEARIQTELSMGDKPKFDKMLQEIEDIKTKYEFKAAKYKALQVSVNDLIDKTILYAKSKI